MRGQNGTKLDNFRSHVFLKNEESQKSVICSIYPKDTPKRQNEAAATDHQDGNDRTTAPLNVSSNVGAEKEAQSSMQMLQNAWNWDQNTKEVTQASFIYSTGEKPAVPVVKQQTEYGDRNSSDLLMNSPGRLVIHQQINFISLDPGASRQPKFPRNG